MSADPDDREQEPGESPRRHLLRHMARFGAALAALACCDDAAAQEPGAASCLPGPTIPTPPQSFEEALQLARCAEAIHRTLAAEAAREAQQAGGDPARLMKNGLEKLGGLLRPDEAVRLGQMIDLILSGAAPSEIARGVRALHDGLLATNPGALGLTLSGVAADSTRAEAAESGKRGPEPGPFPTKAATDLAGAISLANLGIQLGTYTSFGLTPIKGAVVGGLLGGVIGSLRPT
jgi:hypothetical protein